ncbi:MAG: glycosyltransferase family 9 protein, partial [Terriglobales bacterium]
LLERGSGAPQRATFLGLRHGWAYNLRTPPKSPPPGRARLHTVEHIASMFEALGMPTTALGPLQLFATQKSRQRMRQRLAQRGITGAYAFLTTEAREPGLRWPAANFRELAEWLKRERGLASVMASAGAGEPVAGAVLISGTTVEELIALEAEAELVVGNDGGPIHIAAALGKPVVALYSTTDIEVWSPWQARARWLQAHLLAGLTPGRVAAEIAALLA